MTDSIGEIRGQPNADDFSVGDRENDLNPALTADLEKKSVWRDGLSFVGTFIGHDLVSVEIGKFPKPGDHLKIIGESSPA